MVSDGDRGGLYEWALEGFCLHLGVDFGAGLML